MKRPGRKHKMLDRLKRKNWQTWCERFQIDLVVLFGSQAREEGRQGSDVDLALFSYRVQLRPRVLKLMGALEDFLGREADLVIIDGLTDPVLRLEVFRCGVCLYESAPGLFLRQKIAAYSIYEDTAPIRRFRDRVLAERIKRL